MAVYRYLSPQRRLDRVLQVIGALAAAAAVVSGVLTVTGVLRVAAWLGQLLALMMLGGGAVAWLGFAIGVGPLVWAALAVGCLGWLAIPVWVLFVGRALARSRDYLPVSPATLSPAA